MPQGNARSVCACVCLLCAEEQFRGVPVCAWDAASRAGEVGSASRHPQAVPDKKSVVGGKWRRAHTLCACTCICARACCATRRLCARTPHGYVHSVCASSPVPCRTDHLLPDRMLNGSRNTTAFQQKRSSTRQRAPLHQTSSPGDRHLSLPGRSRTSTNRLAWSSSRMCTGGWRRCSDWGCSKMPECDLLHTLITQAGGFADMERYVPELYDEVRVAEEA